MDRRSTQGNQYQGNIQNRSKTEEREREIEKNTSKQECVKQHLSLSKEWSEKDKTNLQEGEREREKKNMSMKIYWEYEIINEKILFPTIGFLSSCSSRRKTKLNKLNTSKGKTNNPMVNFSFHISLADEISYFFFVQSDWYLREA